MGPNKYPSYKTGDYRIDGGIKSGRFILQNPEIHVFSERPFPRNKIIVGFMGPAGIEADKSGDRFEPTPKQKETGERIGQLVAAREHIMANGATLGIPYFATRGASKNGGYTLGFSPYQNKAAHEKGIGKAIKYLDLVIFTGGGDDFKQGLVGFRQDLVNRDVFYSSFPDVASSDDGRWGTLHELAQIMDQGRIYVPVETSEGATGLVIAGIDGKIRKDTGAVVFRPSKHSNGLEDAMNFALDEAEKRWRVEGRTENRFAYVIDGLEMAMGVDAKHRVN